MSSETVFPNSPLFAGIINDLKARLPLYPTDFHNIFTLKVLASILFMFFTSLGPAITFASLIFDETDGEIGTIEVMFATAITGIIFAIFLGNLY
jgi:hypothetical protein